jgi:hypothetical protein
MILVTMGRNLERLVLAALYFLVIGYMVQGRGFAYVGVPPLYVGELILTLCIVGYVFIRVRSAISGLQILIIGFLAFGLIRTVPYYDDFGLDALRDAALWYYAFFALIASQIITREQIKRGLRAFAANLPFIMLWYLFMSTVLRLVEGQIPHFPGSPVPLLSVMKPSDRAVILVVLAAFMATGLYDRFSVSKRMPTTIFWVIWTSCAGIIAIETRGGLLAIAVSFLVLFIMRPSTQWTKPILLGVVFVTIIAIADSSLPLEIRGRSLSFEQLRANVTSIYSSQTSNLGSVQDNRNFRLQWWNEIIDDTVGGQKSLAGWGFGVNLTTAYGIGPETTQLRSPHNGHITVLARMGLPGALLWIAINATFAFQVAIRIRRSHASSYAQFDSNFYAWILAIWVAIMIDAAFDVYLESPQGGILYWLLIGLGIASWQPDHGTYSASIRPVNGTSHREGLSEGDK